MPILNKLRNNVEQNLDLAGLKSFSSKEAICKNKTKASFILEGLNSTVTHKISISGRSIILYYIVNI